MAKVTKPFRGRPDDEIRVRQFQPGDTVTGELAAIAVREGWAADEGGAVAQPFSVGVAGAKPVDERRFATNEIAKPGKKRR